MSLRRDNRIAALQFLYMWEINPGDTFEGSLADFFAELDQPEQDYAFAERLARGVLEEREKLDAMIKKYAENWDFSRIAKIDLTILRLALYEMNFCPDIPPIVSINEAIDLSKVFSIDEAKRFINGILDRCKLDLQRPLRHAAN